MDNLLPIKILSNIPQGKGVLWEHIEVFKNQLLEIEGVIKHQAGTEQSVEMADVYPLKQTLRGGLYTRELFMPKGHIIVSMIHKQDHPSFLLKGKVSYLTDEGTVETITAPQYTKILNGVVYIKQIKKLLLRQKQMCILMITESCLKKL